MALAYLLYFENSGGATPEWTLSVNQTLGELKPRVFRTGYDNSGAFTDLRPSCVDWDGDGDLDLFLGSAAGTVAYWRNIGTPSLANFTLETSANNPLRDVNVGGYSAPCCKDFNQDGLPDCVIGSTRYFFFKNSGKPNEPVFEESNPVDNPFYSLNQARSAVNTGVSLYLTPFCSLFDSDSKTDCIVGKSDGALQYLRYLTISFE